MVRLAWEGTDLEPAAYLVLAGPSEVASWAAGAADRPVRDREGSLVCSAGRKILGLASVLEGEVFE